MKTIKTLVFSFLFLSAFNIWSQDTNFGLSAGLLSSGERFTQNNGSASASDNGFYAGVFTQIQLRNKLSLQPALTYGNISGSHFGFLAARLNYHIIPKGYLQLGPELTHIFESLGPGLNRNGLNASMGIGYNITPKIHVQARYAPEITNRIKNNAIDATSRIHSVQVGMGFVF